MLRPSHSTALTFLVAAAAAAFLCTKATSAHAPTSNQMAVLFVAATFLWCVWFVTSAHLEHERVLDLAVCCVYAWCSLLVAFLCAVFLAASLRAQVPVPKSSYWDPTLLGPGLTILWFLCGVFPRNSKPLSMVCLATGLLATLADPYWIQAFQLLRTLFFQFMVAWMALLFCGVLQRYWRLTPDDPGPKSAGTGPAGAGA